MTELDQLVEILPTLRVEMRAAFILPLLRVQVGSDDTQLEGRYINLMIDAHPRFANRYQLPLYYLMPLKEKDSLAEYARRALQSMLDSLVEALSEVSWAFDEPDTGRHVEVAPDFMLGDGQGGAMWWVPDPQWGRMKSGHDRMIRVDERHQHRPGYRRLTSKEYWAHVGIEKNTPRRIDSPKEEP